MLVALRFQSIAHLFSSREGQSPYLSGTLYSPERPSSVLSQQHCGKSTLDRSPLDCFQRKQY